MYFNEIFKKIDSSLDYCDSEVGNFLHSADIACKTLFKIKSALKENDLETAFMLYSKYVDNVEDMQNIIIDLFENLEDEYEHVAALMSYNK